MFISLKGNDLDLIFFFEEFEKDLIAVLLVVQSVHDKNKLLYKYEQRSPDKRRRNTISANRGIHERFV